MNITKCLVGVGLMMSLMSSSVGIAWALSGGTPDPLKLQVICTPVFPMVSGNILVGDVAGDIGNSSEKLLGTSEQLPEIGPSLIKAQELSFVTEANTLPLTKPVILSSQAVSQSGEASSTGATDAVPEPASFLLFGAGILGLWGLLRKRFSGR